MTSFNTFRTIVFATLLLPFATLSAHEFRIGDIVVYHPWARPLPAVSVNGAAYIKIHNTGKSDRLLSAHSPAAERVEVHRHLHEDGVMKMRKVEGLDVPQGEMIIFEPGGLHLMMLGLSKPLVEGESFPVILQFEHAGELEVTVKIEQPKEGEAMEADSMKHDDTKTEEMDHSGHSN